MDREELGKIVRAAWVEFARTRPVECAACLGTGWRTDPGTREYELPVQLRCFVCDGRGTYVPTHHIVPWEGLDEWTREVDRRVGEAVRDAVLGSPAVSSGWPGPGPATRAHEQRIADAIVAARTAMCAVPRAIVRSEHVRGIFAALASANRELECAWWERRDTNCLLDAVAALTGALRVAVFRETEKKP